MILEHKYSWAESEVSDINEHIPTLKKYAEGCDTVIEMGVRNIVSTWGLLAAKPKKLISIDLYPPHLYGGDIGEVYTAAKEVNVDFEFRVQSTLTNDIEECDFLFIDTLHTYEQLSQELPKHGNKAKKFLAFHDTETFGSKDEVRKEQLFGAGNNLNEGVGLQQAIDEFLMENPHWVIEKVFTNNNGLTILKRIEEAK